MRKQLIALVVILCVVAAATAVIAGDSENDEMKARQGRERIDLEAKTTLERLFAENESGKELKICRIRQIFNA